MRRQMGMSLVVVLLLLLAWPVAGLAAEAGKVIAARGEVTVANAAGDLRALKRGDLFDSGETISTGANSFVRLKFSDGGSIHLRAASRLVIDDYAFNEAGKKDKSEFNLLRGGFRAVTGAIGRDNKEAYSVRTPVSTIGIRGTDYQVRLCFGDCIDLGIDVPEDGLYTATFDGATVINGIEIGPGLFSFTTPSGATVLLEIGPDVLRLDVLPPPDTEGDDTDASGGEDFVIPARDQSVLTLECPL